MLIIFAICIAVIVYGYRLSKQPPKSRTTHYFSTEHISVSVSFLHYPNDDSFVGRAQRYVNLWALELDDPKLSKELYSKLDVEFRKNGLAEYEPETISINIIPPEPQQAEKPAPPTEPELLKANLMGKVGCAETLLDTVEWLKKEKPHVANMFLKSGRTIAREVEDLKDEAFQGLEDALKHEVNGLFHDPNRVR